MPNPTVYLIKCDWTLQRKQKCCLIEVLKKVSQAKLQKFSDVSGRNVNSFTQIGTSGTSGGRCSCQIPCSFHGAASLLLTHHLRASPIGRSPPTATDKTIGCWCGHHTVCIAGYVPATVYWLHNCLDIHVHKWFQSLNDRTTDSIWSDSVHWD